MNDKPIEEHNHYVNMKEKNIIKNTRNVDFIIESLILVL